MLASVLACFHIALALRKVRQKTAADEDTTAARISNLGWRLESESTRDSKTDGFVSPHVSKKKKMRLGRLGTLQLRGM